MKKLILAVMMAGIAWTAQAQEVTKVQPIEGEVHFGITAPLGNFHNGHHKADQAFGAELRYNFAGSKWDCGLAFEVSAARYGFQGHSIFDPSIPSESVDIQQNASFSLLAVGNYNFRQGTKVNPYAGLGIGFSRCIPCSTRVYDMGRSVRPAFMPRVGVELFHHLRIGAFATINRSGYNNMGITIGAVIGGRPKKAK